MNFRHGRLLIVHIVANTISMSGKQAVLVIITCIISYRIKEELENKLRRRCGQAKIGGDSY